MTIKRTKSALPFFPFNADGNPMFAVQKGVPLRDALEQASSFLSIASTAARDAGVKNDDETAFTAAYLVDMSNALVNAVIASMSWEGA